MEDLEIKKEIYLKRLDDPFVTLGVLIPSKVVHRGREIRLKEEVAGIKRDASENSPGWRKRAMELLVILKQMEEDAEDELRRASDEEEIRKAFRRALGPLRAAQELTTLLEGEIYEFVEGENIEDLKRWLDYVKRLK